jgi:hypothetical protein
MKRMARETIAKNEYYIIEVDTDINRFYATFVGFYESSNVVPNFVSDVAKAMDRLTSGFTSLVDTTQFKTPPQDVLSLFNRAQQELLRRGVSKNAEVVSSAFVEVNLEEVASRSEFGKVMRQFKSMAEALEWLNE